MNKLYRTSPMECMTTLLKPKWAEIERMRVPLSFTAGDPDTRLKLGIADLSCLLRMGLKGPGAAQWLADQGVVPPPDINRWSHVEGGGIVARLGNNEFFVEDALDGTTSVRLKAALGRSAPGVTPVLRQDAALALIGTEINPLLVQTCNVNFNSFRMDERLVIMTSMVGVSVLVVRSIKEGVPLYRIWCDGTFGPYLWKTLLQISKELGGGAIGLDSLFPEAMKLRALPL